MNKKRLLPLAAATLLAYYGTARAEGLLELYEAAKAYDATWQSARNQYDANIARANQARAGILPQAGLTAGVGRNHVVTDVGPSSNQPGFTTDRTFTNQQGVVSASQPLYRPAVMPPLCRPTENTSELRCSSTTSAGIASRSLERIECRSSPPRRRVWAQVTYNLSRARVRPT